MIRTFISFASFYLDLSNKKLLNDVIDFDLHQCALVTNSVCNLFFFKKKIDQWARALHMKKPPTHQLKKRPPFTGVTKIPFR